MKSNEWVNGTTTAHWGNWRASTYRSAFVAVCGRFVSFDDTFYSDKRPLPRCATCVKVLEGALDD